MATNEQAADAQAADEGKNEFEFVKARLAEIADAVEDEALSLDDALDLYEEAVSLGLQASDLLEVGISPDEDGEGDESAGESAEGGAAEEGGEGGSGGAEPRVGEQAAE